MQYSINNNNTYLSDDDMEIVITDKTACTIYLIYDTVVTKLSLLTKLVSLQIFGKIIRTVNTMAPVEFMTIFEIEGQRILICQFIDYLRNTYRRPLTVNYSNELTNIKTLDASETGYSTYSNMQLKFALFKSYNYSRRQEYQ